MTWKSTFSNQELSSILASEAQRRHRLEGMSGLTCVITWNLNDNPNENNITVTFGYGSKEDLLKASTKEGS